MPKEPWIGPMWIASRHNFAREVRAKMNLPKKVQIYDVTCRDGEQRPGVVFRKEDKIRIAQKLDEVGIHRIEAGMPAVSTDDFDAVKEVAHLGLKAKTVAFCRARKDDVDLALKCDVWGVLIEVPSSDVLIEQGFNWTRQKVIDFAVEAVGYAKDHGLHVTFFPYDTTRADPVYEKKLMTTVVKQSRPDAIAVVDTFGCASPFAMAHLVGLVKKWVRLPVEVHCHNDLGLAVANSLGGVSGGAEVVHTNVNGIGERAGGAATEEVAVGLRILFGLDLGLRYEKLTELSKLVQDITGIKVLKYKAVVGDTAFGYEAGIPVMFCRRLSASNNLKAGLSYLPEFVGNKFVVVLGKKSGGASIEWRLAEIGKTATPDQVDKILMRVKETSLKNKREVLDEEFKQIVAEVLG